MEQDYGIEEGNGLLGHEAGAYERKARRRWDSLLTSRLSKRQLSLIRVLFVLLVFLLAPIIWVRAAQQPGLTADSHADIISQLTTDYDASQAPDTLDSPLRIVSSAIFERHSWPGFCRGLVSLSALDYPVPRFSNWTWESDFYGRHVDDDRMIVFRDGGRDQKRGRIDSVMQHLEGFNRFGNNRYGSGPADEGAIVVAVDSYDTVFQLRSSVLLERYHRLNKQAKKRNGADQTVIFGAGGTCLGNSTDPARPWCYLQREAAAAVGGTQQSQYLDPGFMMGPVKDLQKILRRAQQYRRQQNDLFWSGQIVKSDDQSQVDDEESALNLVFTEQQLFREIQKTRSSGILSRFASYFDGGSKGLPDTLPVDRHRLSLVPGKDFEFGIGLDYFSDLVHIQSSTDSTSGREFRVFNPPTKTPVPASGLCKSWIPSIPRDIRGSQNPVVEITSGESSHDAFDPSPTLHWEDASLYTDSCNGHIPAAMLYRGPVDDKSRRRDWNSLWVSDRAKQLLDRQKWRASEAKAELIGGSIIVGAAEGFHPAVDVLKNDVNVGDVHSLDERRPIPWADVCGPWEADVFGQQ